MSSSIPWYLVIVLGVIGLIQTLRLASQSLRMRHRLLRQSERAAQGERQAAVLLEEAGYRITASQASHHWSVFRGDEEYRLLLRADYLVERGDLRFVAEVKTGELATELTSAATRRQLLEYYCAFAVDGVLLVDPQDRRIDVVHFTLPRDSNQISVAPRKYASFAELVRIVLALLLGGAMGRWLL